MATTIGEKIRVRRNELGWSTRELADKMGYANQSAISRIESGERDVPQSKVAQFAKVLRTSVAYLMDWDINASLANITERARNDSGFMSLIEDINELSPEQLDGVRVFVGLMLKND